MRNPAFLAGTVFFYGAMGASAWLWMDWWGDSGWRAVVPGVPAPWPLQVASGIGCGLAVVLAGRWAEPRFLPLRALARELVSALPRLTRPEIAVVAVASGVGEEMFFRGAMQDTLGLWPTVAIFALLHGAFVPKLRLWSIFALVIGILFGWLVAAQGTIVAATIAHVAINGLNLDHLIRRYHPEVRSGP